MGLFKKRTFKTVGKDIGISIQRAKQKEKIIRTLEKEAEQRERERKLNQRIRVLKTQRPTLLKKIVKGATTLGKATKLTGKQIKGTAKKLSGGKRRNKRRTSISAPVKQQAPAGWEGFY